MASWARKRNEARLSWPKGGSGDSLASRKGVESVRNLVGVARPGSSSAPEHGLRFIAVKLTHQLKFRLQPKFIQSPMQSSCLSLLLLPK
jgi:hypothetical protein